MAAFIEQMQVIQTNLRGKTVGIVVNLLLTGGVNPGQLIMSGQSIRCAMPFKQISICQALQGLIKIKQTNLPGAGQKYPNHQTLAPTMATQHSKRVSVKTRAQQSGIGHDPITGRCA